MRTPLPINRPLVFSGLTLGLLGLLALPGPGSAHVATAAAAAYPATADPPPAPADPPRRTPADPPRRRTASDPPRRGEAAPRRRDAAASPRRAPANPPRRGEAAPRRRAAAGAPGAAAASPRRGPAPETARTATPKPRRTATPKPRRTATPKATRSATPSAAAPAPRAPATPTAPARPRAGPAPPAPPLEQPPDAKPRRLARRAPAKALRRRHAPPPTRSWHVRLTGRSVNLLVREPSYDVFSEDDLLARGELALALELNPVDRLVVAVEWGYAGGRRSDPLHQDFTAEQQQHSLLLGAWVGYRFWDAVTPFVRGGFAYTWLEGRVRGDGLSMGGWDQAPGGYVFGGLELALARRWMWRALGTAAFTLALTVEAGWVDLGRFAPGGGLDQSALVDEYRDGLGTLELRGAAVSVGFVLSI